MIVELQAAVSDMPKWTDIWTTIGTVGGAVATFLAVVLAIVLAFWGDWFRTRFFHAQLVVSISRQPPPDCIPIQAAIVAGGTHMGQTDAYFCRLRITNEGHGEATDVQVQLRELRYATDAGAWVIDTAFLPLNLTWSHVVPSTSTWPKLVPGLFAHCDLCYVRRRISPKEVIFCTHIQPMPIRQGISATHKPPGRYEIDIAVSASNAKTVLTTLTLLFTGEWTDDETAMFEEELRVAIAQ